MQTYRVFNENNALVEVTDQDLDNAVPRDDALPTHLANAAGVARRPELIPRLRATLAVPHRRDKLAAARALLAIGDHGAVELLRDHARTETDLIVANLFRAIALRLEGVERVRHAFEQGDEDPALAGVIASIYNGAFDLVQDDIALLLDLIDAYVANAKTWIADMSRDEWRSDLYVMVKALARATAPIPDPARARDVLRRVTTARADRDTKKVAQSLLATL